MQYLPEHGLRSPLPVKWPVEPLPVGKSNITAIIIHLWYIWCWEGGVALRCLCAMQSTSYETAAAICTCEIGADLGGNDSHSQSLRVSSHIPTYGSKTCW